MNGKVMLLIDADNVSIDIMEQGIRLLLNQHGALHVATRQAADGRALATRLDAVFGNPGLRAFAPAAEVQPAARRA